MASSSRTRVQVPISATDECPLTAKSSAFVSKPPLDIDKRAIWEKQVMIPHILSGKMHAFAGPYPSLTNFKDEVKEIFPCYATCEPRIFINSAFDMSFMEPGHRVFRSAPSPNPAYIQWLN
ncbi:hypothetical protein A2U01_0052893, partial [Trifolium medium]|nr:hypothetical protein [Trifolium medium]